MDKKIPDGVVLTAAYALSKEWNLHYPDAVRMAALVLSVGQQWQPAETSNARSEWPARYMANGPQGTFYTDDLKLADALLRAYDEDDDWTVTEMPDPAGTLAATQHAAVGEDLRKELVKAAKCARRTERSIERAKALLAGPAGRCVMTKASGILPAGRNPSAPEGSVKPAPPPNPPKAQGMVDGWRLVVHYSEYDSKPIVCAEKDGSLVWITNFTGESNG